MPEPMTLEPCPFCGSQPQVQPWHGGPITKRIVGCENDDCAAMPAVTGDTEAVAVERWNARATLAQRREEVTEVEQSLRDVILWALGEGDDFPERPDRGEGKPVRLYWWRSELRRRYEAALAASGDSALGARDGGAA